MRLSFSPTRRSLNIVGFLPDFDPGHLICCSDFNAGLEVSHTDAYSAALTSLHIIWGQNQT